MAVIAVIPARGGSKSLPGKNLKKVGGETLVDHAIRCALAVPAIDVTIVSTDDDEIADVASEWGAGVLIHPRPKVLAEDDTATVAVLQDVLSWYKHDVSVVVTLQPTSPLRLPEDVELALEMQSVMRLDSVFSCVQVHDCHPARMLWTDNTYVYECEIENQRRQDLRPCYLRNGAVYVTRASVINAGSMYGKKTDFIEMPRWRSVNVDDALDLVICEAIYNAYHCGSGERSRGQPA